LSFLFEICAFEMIPASSTAKFDLFNIPLIYRENLAGLRPAGAVNKTARLFCQHGAGEQQVAAGAALTAGTLTHRNLSQNIASSKMNQPKPSQFAACVKDKAGVLKGLGDGKTQTIAKRSQPDDLVKPSGSVLANQLHTCPFLRCCLV
jgi:hypothetical protein